MTYLVCVHDEKRELIAIGKGLDLRTGIRFAARHATFRKGKVLTPTRILGYGFEGAKQVALHLQVS